MELTRTESPKIDSSELTTLLKKHFFQVNTSREMWLVRKISYFSFLEWPCSQALIIFCSLKKIYSYSDLNLSLVLMAITFTIEFIYNISCYSYLLPTKVAFFLFFFNQYFIIYLLSFFFLFFCALVVNYVLYSVENSSKSTRT